MKSRSWAKFPKISLVKLFMMPMALLKIPISGWWLYTTAAIDLKPLMMTVAFSTHITVIGGGGG